MSITKEEIAKDFYMSIDILEECDIICGYYNMDGYEGDHFVLFEEDGVLYWNFGSHCSCYGLEGQWDPEQVSIQELEKRVASDYHYGAFEKCLTEVKAYISQGY
jgi:hypothetical protein